VPGVPERRPFRRWLIAVCPGRFVAGMGNIFRLYRAILDDWWLYYESRLPPKLVAFEVKKHLVVKKRGGCSGGSKNNGRVTVKRKTEHSLTTLADAAFQQAAKKVIKRAKDSGTAVIVWEIETVKRVDPRRARTKKNGRPTEL